jgi:catechol 2,3-dioxygenase-like lactoylglutathione lyase family enzyme
MKPRIIAMDHIVLNVADIDRALAFYVDVLGLQPERVDQFRRGEIGFPSVRVNESTIIDLFPAAGSGGRGAAANLNHYCLVAEPTDLEALAAELRARGVEVTRGPASRWGARGQATSIYVLDPDGNELELRHY